MNGRQLRETERNIRTSEFLNANAADFARNAMAKADIADLNERVGLVQAAYRLQLASGDSVRHDYGAVKDLYGALLDDMRDIAGFARSMTRRTPNIDDLFRVPPGSGRRSLIAAARVFAENAAPYKQKFVDYGMDETFVEDLLERADALEAALNAAAASSGERVGATGTLESEVDAASDIVEALDPIVRRIYRNNQTKLAAWTFATHVERHTPVARPPKTDKSPS